MQKVTSPLLLKSARSLERYNHPLLLSSTSSVSLLIMQMQLLAVWVLADWMVAGEPRKCQLIELGPGRGTLLKDMLRVRTMHNNRDSCSAAKEEL